MKDDQFFSRIKPLAGTTAREVRKGAESLFHAIERRSRRTPYVRSAYFQKQKVFLTLFWRHLESKSWPDRVRRLRLFPCGIDLIRNSKISPTTQDHPLRRDELLHRFYGKVTTGQRFAVQIKEEKRTGRKYFLSVFPL